MTAISKENLEKQIVEAASSLLNIARESCWNNISTNCSFILSEINYSDFDFNAERKIKHSKNRRKKPAQIEQLMPSLLENYHDLHLIELYLYKSTPAQSIIEIQYLLKSKAELSHRQPPMLHCKVAIPPYAAETREKFNINWELNPLGHRWRMFWWRRKARAFLKAYDKNNEARG